jgi:hypothetical protein
VVGANQLGSVDAGQVQLLHAQLARLHGEFADAIASGSEFRLREARKRYDRAATLIDRASEAIAAIIGGRAGHIALERAARGLGTARKEAPRRMARRARCWQARQLPFLGCSRWTASASPWAPPASPAPT